MNLWYLWWSMPVEDTMQRSANGFRSWVCLKMVYTPNYSHLAGIMIINHWVFRGTLFSDKPSWWFWECWNRGPNFECHQQHLALLLCHQHCGIATWSEPRPQHFGISRILRKNPTAHMVPHDAAVAPTLQWQRVLTTKVVDAPWQPKLREFWCPETSLLVSSPYYIRSWADNDHS